MPRGTARLVISDAFLGEPVDDATNSFGRLSDAAVIRGGRKTRIDSVGIVPGDVVLLQSGDKVPADLRLVRCPDLQIAEAAHERRAWERPSRPGRVVSGPTVAQTPAPAPVTRTSGIHSGRNSTRFRISACVMTDAMRASSRTAPPTVTRSFSCVTDGVFRPAAVEAACDALPAFLPARPITHVHLATLGVWLVFSQEMVPDPNGTLTLAISDPEGTVPVRFRVKRERWLVSSVVFRDLSGVPEFIELGVDERIELLRELLRKSVDADQLDYISQVLKSMGSCHPTGDLQFKQGHKIDVGHTFVMNFPH